MCVESIECTKFGGIAIFCRRTLGGLYKEHVSELVEDICSSYILGYLNFTPVY